ncbi:hypothetical protein GLYMA_13G201150v4 [Glycine max]|nr:hypothetical protein GLYMA_13G201150v4 [Glycine max]KAH1102432.1 hypothetical protein GYH30_036801 [Glycine max]
MPMMTMRATCCPLILLAVDYGGSHHWYASHLRSYCCSE